MKVLRRTLEQLAILGAVALGASACALSYDDAAGQRHVIGLADVSLAPASNSDTLAGTVVKVDTLGLSIARNAQGSSFSLGYSSQTTAAIRDNALVLGNPNQAISQIFQTGSK